MTKKTVLALVVLALFSQITTTAKEDFYDETVLRTLRLEFSQPDWWSRLEANAQTDNNIVAALTVDGVTYEGVGVRFRGMTSYSMIGNSKKKSFNIKIDYTGENQRLMGYKTLNLINCFDDPTFMREPLYSNIVRQLMPSAKANFVKLEINGENWGIYANIQQINAEFLEDWFTDNSGTCWCALGAFADFGQPPADRQTPQPQPDEPSPRIRQMAVNELLLNEAGLGGFGNGSAALTWQGSEQQAYEAVYEIKSTEQDNPWDSLINTCDVLNNTPLEQLPEEIEAVLNIDRALWLCAFEIIFHDDDGYVSKRGSDYYLYYEPQTGQINVIQYDANTCMKWSNAAGWSIFYGETDPQIPLMYRLMAVKQYRQRYLAHVRTILNSFLTEETLFPKIDTYRALIEEQVNLDDKKLYSNQAFAGGIDQLKEFVLNRRNSILSNRLVNVPAPEIISVGEEVVQNGTDRILTITACLNDKLPIADVQLYIADGFFGRFVPVTMVDDGQHGDGQALDGTFGYTLPGYPAGTVLRYYVQATADNGFGTLVFSPEGAEHNTYIHIVTYDRADSTPVVINELMARNNSTITDPQGDYDDWIELANITSEAVDLSGMYLSDNPENPLKWQFPEGTKIEPEGHLIVWADEDGSDEPGLHANFKLSSQGETIWLFDTDEQGNALLDSVTFGPLNPDISFGRYPDGHGTIQAMSAPSPSAPNIEP
ncbi:MAG: CotH kinase family protein [Sedimentisphaerales bacterium]|nr:CotH kinase family protein [Sedimentisphaerales bacterium]